MNDAITAGQFHAADGIEDWRALLFVDAVCACFRTGSFAKGVELVDAIGRLADAANHHPDVDLRYGSVTVRLTSHDVGTISERDLGLAREISAAARDLGAEPDPSAVQAVNLTIDTASIDAASSDAGSSPGIRPFWTAVLGYRDKGDEDAVDPRGQGPSVWFQPTDEPGGGSSGGGSGSGSSDSGGSGSGGSGSGGGSGVRRNRVHVDVAVPHDQAEARVAAAVEAGGRLVSDRFAPAWWTLADAEGNEVDIATWQGRE